MAPELNILVTNDDGYRSKGLDILTDMLRPMGRITSIAPKYHQSGMSMAVSMGCKAIAYRPLPADGLAFRAYIDATPASCVKYGLDNIMVDDRPRRRRLRNQPRVQRGDGRQLFRDPRCGGGSGAERHHGDRRVAGHLPSGCGLLRRTTVFPGDFPQADGQPPRAPGHLLQHQFPRPAGRPDQGRARRTRGLRPLGTRIPALEPRPVQPARYRARRGGCAAGPALRGRGDALHDGRGLRGRFARVGHPGRPPSAPGRVYLVAHRVDNTDYDEIARLAATGFNEDFR